MLFAKAAVMLGSPVTIVTANGTLSNAETHAFWRNSLSNVSAVAETPIISAVGRGRICRIKSAYSNETNDGGDERRPSARAMRTGDCRQEYYHESCDETHNRTVNESPHET